MAGGQARFEPLTADDLRTLQIAPPAELQPLFRFYEVPPGLFTESWDVIGVREVQPPSAVLEFRLFHLEQELIEDGWGHEDDADWPFFDTFGEADGRVSLSVEEYLAALAFFTSWLREGPSGGADDHPRFRWLDWDELAVLHVRPIMPDEPSRYYRYLPDERIAANPHDISLIRVPAWDGRYPPNQRGGLAFLTFERRLLADPTFDPRHTWGLGSLLLNQAALRDLVVLLAQHTYDRARLRAAP